MDNVKIASELVKLARFLSAGKDNIQAAHNMANAIDLALQNLSEEAKAISKALHVLQEQGLNTYALTVCETVLAGLDDARDELRHHRDVAKSFLFDDVEADKKRVKASDVGDASNVFGSLAEKIRSISSALWTGFKGIESNDAITVESVLEVEAFINIFDKLTSRVAKQARRAKILIDRETRV